MAVALADPGTHDPLEARVDGLYNRRTAQRVAEIRAAIPRFVESTDNYAENFGWQWKHWKDTLSDARNTGAAKRDLILERTRFAEYDLKGKSILECGMGGGDDTEVLLSLPFSEVHSFDLSTAVERARDTLNDPRLTISQASIYEMPYPDRSFDFVYCHRVLQHTPHPAKALRAICKKVKPGGVLFAHSYRLSLRSAMNFKYKYRWLTRRLPHRYTYAFVSRYGPWLHRMSKRLRNGNFVVRWLAYNFVPFEWKRAYGEMSEEELLEHGMLDTFDALTPRYDRPMTSRKFKRILASEGFRLEHFFAAKSSPLWGTAVKR